MANKRIYYAVQQVAFSNDLNTWNAVHGLQSVGMTTTFNLDQVFELGQLAIYENVEGIPDVEMTLSKVLDGYELIYHLATRKQLDGTNTTSPTLAGRSNGAAHVALSIFNDDAEAANGLPKSQVVMSGMYVSSLGYNIPLEDNATEDVTLVGNNRVWAGIADSGLKFPSYGQHPNQLTNLTVAGTFSLTAPDAPSVGVQKRQNIIFNSSITGIPLAAVGGLSNIYRGSGTDGYALDPDVTVLPKDIPGINISGINPWNNTTKEFGAHVSNITVSCDLGREEIYELGRRGPYHRVVTFPVEVTCEIETTTFSGDLVSATEAGVLNADWASNSTCGQANNLGNRTIRIAMCDTTRIFLGTKNKLASINYGGGDAGGGNVSVTYSYTTFNDLTVVHQSDGHASSTAFWNDRYKWVSSPTGIKFS